VREDREDRELLAETGGAPLSGGGKRGRLSDDRTGNGSAYSNAGGTQARCVPSAGFLKYELVISVEGAGGARDCA